MFSSSSFSKIADMKFVLKQNMKKDEQGAGRWEEIKLKSSMTFGRCEPNWCFSVFAALAAAEHLHICSPLNSQRSAVEPEVIISWCHWLNDGFRGLERVPHKEEQVLCWMELLGLLLSWVLKDLGNKKGHLMSLRRGFDLTSFLFSKRWNRLLCPLEFIIHQKRKRNKQQQTLILICSFDMAGFPISSHCLIISHLIHRGLSATLLEIQAELVQTRIPTRDLGHSQSRCQIVSKRWQGMRRRALTLVSLWDYDAKDLESLKTQGALLDRRNAQGMSCWAFPPKNRKTLCDWSSFN